MTHHLEILCYQIPTFLTNLLTPLQTQSFHPICSSFFPPCWLLITATTTYKQSMQNALQPSFLDYPILQQQAHQPEPRCQHVRYRFGRMVVQRDFERMDPGRKGGGDGGVVDWAEDEVDYAFWRRGRGFGDGRKGFESADDTYTRPFITSSTGLLIEYHEAVWSPVRWMKGCSKK